MADVVIHEEADGSTRILIWEDPGYQRKVEGWLSPFPGSETMWVSHGLYIPKEYRGLGLSKRYDEEIKKYVLNDKGGTAIVASVKTDNKLQHKRLEFLGWERISNALWITRRSDWK